MSAPIKHLPEPDGGTTPADNHSWHRRHLQAATADPAAFAPLYHRYATDVYDFCHRRLHHPEEADEHTYRSIGDEEQTDKTFDADIIDRMGDDFYTEVFAPAIEEARSSGSKYEDIRDDIRQNWKPERSARQ